MSSSHGSLAALITRLQSISQLPVDYHDPLIKLEDLEIDTTRSKYICAECAWTTSANAGALARHFMVKHTIRVKCPDCKNVCGSEDLLKQHRSQKHRHLCPSCQRFFATVNECQQHEPCGREHRIVSSTMNGTLSQTTIDPPIGGKAPASGQSILNRKGSVQSGSCPDPGCQLTFSDFDTLYDHYVGLHPLHIVYHGHPKPFKCPFCPKRYQYDRFIPGHIRTHKSKSSNNPRPGDAEDQEALIRQSHVAMANRDSKFRAEAEGLAEHFSNDEQKDYPVFIKEEEERAAPIEEEEEEEPSLVLKEGVLYMNERVEQLSPRPKQSDQIEEQNAQHFRETTPIGFMLQASPADLLNSHPANGTPSLKAMGRGPSVEPELSDLMDLDDDYPERFALDDDELPPKTKNSETSVIATQRVDVTFHRSLSHEIIRALRMQHFINVSEVVDLFNYFLDEHQRVHVLEQLASISLNQHDSIILEALHSTVFKTLIDAWIDFKRLAIRFAPQLILQANEQKISSGKSVTWALLQYCLHVEHLIYRNKVNIAHHFLRGPPLDDFVITTDAPFPRLVAALGERVKNRTVHDMAIVFTNGMILREMGDYVKILQMVFRPIYPLAAGHELLWRELRLL